MNVFIDAVDRISLVEFDKAVEKSNFKVGTFSATWVGKDNFPMDIIKVRGNTQFVIKMFKSLTPPTSRADIINECDGVICFVRNKNKANQIMEEELVRIATEQNKPIFVHKID